MTSAACFCLSSSPLYATSGAFAKLAATSVALYQDQSVCCQAGILDTSSFWKMFRNSGVSEKPAPGLMPHQRSV